MLDPLDILARELTTLDKKPLDTHRERPSGRTHSWVSDKVALTLAAELRQRGLHAARPALPGGSGLSGAERRMAGGIATEESGLLLAISVKSINAEHDATGKRRSTFLNAHDSVPASLPAARILPAATSSMSSSTSH